MLDLAINHAEELQKCFRSIWFQDKYKFIGELRHEKRNNDSGRY